MTDRKTITDPGRPLTVAELVFRLADFDGDEPVYYSEAGRVGSATRYDHALGPFVLLSPEPEEPREPEPPSWWRAIVRGTAEALRGLGAVRVRRGPLRGGEGRR